MFALSALIIVAVAALTIGLIMGVLLSSFISPQGRQTRGLEQKIHNYHKEVNNHFVETSLLINKFTQSYRDVYEHLASGALDLTNIDTSRRLIAAGKGKLDTVVEKSLDQEDFQPPRDWAPRKRIDT